MVSIESAATAIRDGELVVYPTETVYGLGANALDADTIERVFAVKGRPHEKPISLAVSDVEQSFEYTRPTAEEKRFMREFLPGPVTVLVEAREMVPDVLTAGNARVGVRVPDHPMALSLLQETAPLTATSANRSGNPSAKQVDEVDESVRAASAVVLDGGALSGVESTVVDVSAGTIHRRGVGAEAIAAWLD
ncbi:MAG TPA: L-threonylcarbamoyladenylate synthase [Halococcus sp.]|nr:L-threonylcarbamoyladenylate synthase [Halococcus sp.]